MAATLDELYEQGMDAFSRSDYTLAENLFHRILGVNPRFADILNKMGLIYSQTNRPDLAAKSFEQALAINPGYTEASLNLAITYHALNQYDKAREVFERAARISREGSSDIDPFIKGKLANEHLKIGNIYANLGKFPDAIDEYEKALRLAPNFADIITQLGIALRETGQYDEALKQFNRAKEANANFIPARLHLGITYYSRGFYGLAEEEWQAALKIDPKNLAVKTYLNFVKPPQS
ncbi:MAG: tetratricopeptide repeat protein [Nitrospirota bacterium]|nr:tetratricopeptide repeat protein [Nitrospirota bacterium]